MKVPGAESMNRAEVNQAFDTLKAPDWNLGHDYGLSGNWPEDRGVLFPQQYADDRDQFLDRTLHNYIRSKAVHNSGRLTKDRFLAIVRQLDSEDIYWPLQPNFKEHFFEILQQNYPDCCDGIPPKRFGLLPTMTNQSRLR